MGLLNDAGRATLTKVTLSAIPVHVSIATGLSAWALRQLDKRRHMFLWAGTEAVAGEVQSSLVDSERTHVLWKVKRPGPETH